MNKEIDGMKNVWMKYKLNLEFNKRYVYSKKIDIIKKKLD
jgi:hypothetical protein